MKVKLDRMSEKQAGPENMEETPPETTSRDVTDDITVRGQLEETDSRRFCDETDPKRHSDGADPEMVSPRSENTEHVSTENEQDGIEIVSVTGIIYNTLSTARIAQLIEHLICKQVVGLSLNTTTTTMWLWSVAFHCCACASIYE